MPCLRGSVSLCGWGEDQEATKPARITKKGVKLGSMGLDSGRSYAGGFK